MNQLKDERVGFFPKELDLHVTEPEKIEDDLHGLQYTYKTEGGGMRTAPVLAWSPIIEMFPTSLLATLLVALAILPNANGLVVRKSPVTLALSRHFSATGMKNLYQHDLNRAQFLKTGGGHTKRTPTPQDSAMSHLATVGVGAGTCEFFNNDTLHPAKL